MDQTFDLSAYLAILKRRWPLVVAPVVLLAPLVLAVAYVLPPVYSATARVLVEGQAIPTDLVRSTVDADAGQRIALIEQRLMTRENLLDLADRFDLYEGRRDMSPSEIVEQVRASIEIVGVRQPLGVDITFSSRRPEVAARVANRLMDLVLEENIRQRNTSAFETSDYFRREVERLSDLIAAQENRITEFKNANRDALPDSLAFRRNELSQLRDRQFERDLRRAELEERQAELQRAIQEGEFDFAFEGSPERQELNRLRDTLARQRTVYAESHPAIRSLVSRISLLEEAMAAAGQDPDAQASVLERVEETAANIDEQLAMIEEQRAAEEERAAALEASIERTPAVELQLGALTRELRTFQTQFDDAILKQARAETGERLEVNQQAERFVVLEQAQVPVAPVSPNRPLIAAAGFVGSAGIGVGLMILAELLNQSVRTAADLERRLDLRPVVTIPYIRTQRELLLRKWIWRTVAFLILVVTPAALWTIDQHYLPLPLLAGRVMETLGLDGFIALVDSRFG